MLRNKKKLDNFYQKKFFYNKPHFDFPNFVNMDDDIYHLHQYVEKALPAY